MIKQFIFFLIFMSLASLAFSKSKNAKIIFFQGESYILKYNRAYQKKPVKINTIIMPKDIIITGRNGMVKIKLADTSEVVIKENSKIRFSLVSNKIQRIQVREGGILSSVNKLLNNKGYIVETPRGVAGVRGTEFIVEYDKKDDLSSVEVNSGKVKISQDKIEKLPFAIIKYGKIEYGKEIKVERKTTSLNKAEGISFDDEKFLLEKRQKNKARVATYKYIDGWEFN